MKIMSLVFLLLLSGCASMRSYPGKTITPELDSKFGDAVRAARAAQTVDPNAANKTSLTHSLDTHTAKTVVDAYQSGGQGTSGSTGASR
jgi:type IV pilus biogenesis protein CpaD/CtpE